MAITLNKVGIEIDGKVYEFYKLSFGFQRKLIEVQSNVSKLQNTLAKKYSIEVSELDTSDKVTNDEKLELAKAGLEVTDALRGLFVNKEEAVILDNFDSENLTELVNSLK